MDRWRSSNHMKRIIVYIVGIFIMAGGMSLTIKAELGTGAWPALFVGLYKTMGLTVGTWTFIVGLTLIFINAILLKERPSLISLLPIFILGIFIDLFLVVIFQGFFLESLMIRWITLVVSLIVFTIGLATYLQAKLATIPIDGLMIAIQRRFNKSLRKAKIFIDVGALFFAFLFSGPIGVGTIVFTFLSGPLTQFFYKRIGSKLTPILFSKHVKGERPLKESI